jgi:hypothetical protein
MRMTMGALRRILREAVEQTASHRALARLSNASGVQVNRDPDDDRLDQSLDVAGGPLVGVDYHGRLVARHPSDTSRWAEVAEDEAADDLIAALSLARTADTQRAPDFSDKFGPNDPTPMDPALFASLAQKHGLWAAPTEFDSIEVVVKARAGDANGAQWQLRIDGLAYAEPRGKAHARFGDQGLATEEFDEALATIAWEPMPRAEDLRDYYDPDSSDDIPY